MTLILDDPAASSREQLTAPLVAVLGQLHDVLDRLTDEQYARKPVGQITSSIGGHVRHCLDHVRELLRLADGHELDYDRRERGTDVEARRSAALNLIAELSEQLVDLPADAPDRTVFVSTMLACDQPPLVVSSSFAREFAFVLSHTIHHHALIGVMVKTLGGWLPEKFGYAPSTLADQASPRTAVGRPCAR
jgi:uncharacterized damage-inducible protein DinB